jgi:hypothetical protein
VRKSSLFRELEKTNGFVRDQLIGGKPRGAKQLSAKQASPHNIAASRGG